MLGALVALAALGAGGVAVPPVPPAAAAPRQTEPGPAAPGPEPRYAPPVDAPVIDPFRPPPHRYGPGNRGLSYGVAPLTPIRAIGDGEVIFAGPVAGALHVTIRHPDGLRSSYSYLAASAVAVGRPVHRGDLVGWSSDVFHLGVRRPDGEYLDPSLLWRERVPQLVPGGDDGTDPAPEPVRLQEVARARSGPLSSWVASGGSTLAAASPATLARFEHRLRLLHHYATELQPATHHRRMVEAVDRWATDRRDCTTAGSAVAPPAERRIVVEVGGIGSTSDGAAVADLDTDALGYEPGDVLRFSYEGGRVPPADRTAADPFAAVTTSEYGPIASQQDLHESARRLAALLDEVARAAPGVPIDVVAHSQGGVVARLALDHADRTGTRSPQVEHLVTLGSPHQGADLATAIDAVGTDATAATELEQIRRRIGVELDPTLPAAGQLAEVSPVVDRLRDLPAPDGVVLTSVAARGDLVVTAGRTAAPGARRATVSLSGPSAHDRLPGSAEATREVLLAVTGHPPGCRSLPDTLVDAAVSDGIGLLEDLAGAGALGIGATLPGG